MTDAAGESNQPRRLSQTAKTLVDFGPLAVFFVIYFFGRRLSPLTSSLFGERFAVTEGQELFAALIVYMPVFAVAFIYSVWRERRVSPMLMISFVMVVVLGSLTLLLKDRTFFYMKPTIAYALFAATLTGGLLSGANLLKAAFDGALHLPDAAWRTLTVRYAAFFAVLAVANEVAWRWLMRDCDINSGLACAGEPRWVQLKLFGFTAANVVFAGLQAPFITRHLQEAPGAGAGPSASDTTPGETQEAAPSTTQSGGAAGRSRSESVDGV